MENKNKITKEKETDDNISLILKSRERKELINENAQSISKIPKAFRSLWENQYKPRELAILEKASKEGIKIWEKLSFERKINFIDKMQERGEFVLGVRE